MNDIEENIYKEIKNELVQSVIDKRIDNYFVNKNELSHYYNVGKMLIDAQGGEEKAKYGDSLIKKYSIRLTNELGHGYSTRTLKLMRKYYLFQKGQALPAQLSWSHYVELLALDDINEISYYTDICITQKISYRKLHTIIKNKEYQKLSDEARNKLIHKENPKVYDLVKNPITVNTYGIKEEEITEKVLKAYILKDMDNFLLQLGNGFSYIANEYKIKIGNSYNYIDILLFNYLYNCFVVVELKVTNLNKNHFGQVMIYKNYIDKILKNANQDNTIGIIVCKKDDKYLIEYSSDERIKVTTYELI